MTHYCARESNPYCLLHLHVLLLCACLFGAFGSLTPPATDNYLTNGKLSSKELHRFLSNPSDLTNLTASSDERFKLLLSNNTLSELLRHLSNSTNFNLDLSGLSSLLSFNRTARSGDYSGSSYGGWGGGGYGGGGYGGGYGGNDNGLLLALLLGRRHEHHEPMRQQNSNSDLGPLALLTLLGLALIGRMPTQ